MRLAEVHFLSPWYDPWRFAGRKASSIDLPLHLHQHRHIHWQWARQLVNSLSTLFNKSGHYYFAVFVGWFLLSFCMCIHCHLFSSVQFKVVSMRSGRPICAPPRLSSGVSPQCCGPWNSSNVGLVDDGPCSSSCCLLYTQTRSPRRARNETGMASYLFNQKR